MKYSYESLKEIRVDVDEIWRKMLGFGVCIGLLPLIMIISWNEIQLCRFERNWSWCWWDIQENVRFWSKYRVITTYFDHLMKWNPQLWRAWSGTATWCVTHLGAVDVDEIWRKKLLKTFGVCIGLFTPYFWLAFPWNFLFTVISAVLSDPRSIPLSTLKV